MRLSAPLRDVSYAAEEHLFRTPVIAGVALEKLLGEGCVQDMQRVVKGAIKLKKLSRKYAKVGVLFMFDSSCFFINVDKKQRPGQYEGSEIIARLSFAEEFSARSWAQVSEEIFGCWGETDECAMQLHSIDWRLLVLACSEEEMRQGLRGESSTSDRQDPY